MNPAHPTATARNESLEFLGVSTHNLREIDVRLPRDAISVITGPSGCGKSSLAFDTIHAEARRQFLDSLSVGLRQSLPYLPRPPIRQTAGLLPVVCVDQNPARPNARSTVATVSDVYDFLRLLMARVGTVRCSHCRRAINQTSSDEIERFVLDLPERTKIMILAEVPTALDSVADQIAEVRRAGYVRVRIDGEIHDLESCTPDTAPGSPRLQAVVDRIISKPGIEDRVTESIAHALEFAGGELTILMLAPDSGDWEERRFSTLYACPDCRISYEEIEPRTFSFYSPFGVCPNCEGRGIREQFSFRKVLGEATGPLTELDVWNSVAPSQRQTRRAEFVDLLNALELPQDALVESLAPERARKLFFGDPSQLGLQTILEKALVTTTDTDQFQRLAEYRAEEPCPACQGSRLCHAANHVFLADQNMGQIVARPVTEAIDFLEQLPAQLDAQEQVIAAPILKECLNRLRFLNQAGVGYLALDRRTDSLSGGEFQRIRLATGLGNRLTDVCYVLDEPTTGLHPADNQRLIDGIRDLQNQGNTVIIVEHDPEIMKIADHILDLGPGGGKAGGTIQAAGTWQEIAAAPQSLTGRYLRGELRIAVHDRRPLVAANQWITITGPRLHNLRGDPFRFPVNRLVCVTGVSGSGKSSLVSGVLVPALRSHLAPPNRGNSTPPSTSGNRSDLLPTWEKVENAELIQDVVEIDQTPIGRSPRSNAATFTGMLDEIRKVFAATRQAKQLGFTASRFSFNNRVGACAACQGQGHRQLEMMLMPDLFVTCEACGGQRYNQATLAVRFKDKTIAQVLELAVDEARDFFANIEKIRRVLDALHEVGLGYLKLNQPATSFSGGEAQRLKIAVQLARQSPPQTLFVFDEPTSGLHFSDIDRLHQLLQNLVDRGNSVLVIEHHLDLIQNADHVIDFGPGAGTAGGRIVAAGSPAEIADQSNSITGRFLAPLLNRP